VPSPATEVRLGVFGGSFDPIHNGHLILAQVAREALGLDRVLLVVSASQPLKPGHGAPAADRLRMVELAVRGIADLVADGREVERCGPSYTVDTLRQLKAEHPGAEMVLLLGSDAAAGLAAWREPEELGRLARIVTYRRGDEPVPAGIEHFEVPRIEISSTLIRERAAAGKSLRGWVPEVVADYISGLDLYRTRREVG
jgi:nicotinate-nucleotide adenylyltransferase